MCFDWRAINHGSWGNWTSRQGAFQIRVGTALGQLTVQYRYDSVILALAWPVRKT